MTEPRNVDPLERRLGGLVRAYTASAADRPVDPVLVSRTAMAAASTRRPAATRLGGDILGRWRASDRWVAAAVAVLLVGVALIAIQGRRSGPVVTQPSASGAPSPESSASTGESILALLPLGWQRPSPVAPGADLWGSGYLTMTDGQLAFGREPGAVRSTVALGGPTTIVVTATDATPACNLGDVGTYGWILEGQGTFLTLTPSAPDACPAREALLAGPWVRVNRPRQPTGGSPLAPGTFRSSGFDPFEDPGRPMQLVYTIPAGWDAVADEPGTFALLQPASASAGRFSTDLMIALIADPAVMAEVPDGISCDAAAAAVGDAAGVGQARDELVAAIRARAGVIASPPESVTIDGLGGRQLDLQLAPSWTGSCLSPQGPVVGLPLLHRSGVPGGPLVGLSPDAPVRLILVDVGSERTLAIVLFRLGPSGPATVGELFGTAMPVVRGFAFEPRAP